MRTLKEMQGEIIQNRINRGFPSATDLKKTTKGLREEIGEWEAALESKDVPAQVDALGDIVIFCLGGLEILGRDAQVVLEDIIENNKVRSHKKVH